jgi:cyclohexanecarboxylate-CoA ligase
MTYWDLVCRAADEAPERVILADDFGRTLTTSQLRDAGERTAAALPVSPGDTVSWVLPTCLEAAVLMVALTRLGVRQNPVIPAWRHRELRVVLGQLEPTLFIGPETWRGFAVGDMLRELGASVLALDFTGDPGPELRLPAGDVSALPPIPGHDGQWVYYSSGTTSDPKGVRHTDSSLMASAAGSIELAGLRAPEVYPIAWPLTHIGGVTMLTCTLAAGLKLVLFDSWDPATTPERMATHAPTILGSAQPFFRAYLAAQERHGDEPLYPQLRAFTAGGAPTPPEIARELMEVFGVPGVLGSYGLTEFPIATATAGTDPPEILLRSVGRPSPGVAVRIVDGEIRLKGPQLPSGYVEPAVDGEILDDEGWVRTGDLGAVDADGYVFVTGRLKDIIIRNAENISALEIEDTLLRHPDIADVAVVGLPDSKTGERVCAAIVVAAGRTLDVATVAAFCQSQGLAKYKCPESVTLVDGLPRNSMGKLLKHDIRTALLSPHEDDQ